MRGRYLWRRDKNGDEHKSVLKVFYFYIKNLIRKGLKKMKGTRKLLISVIALVVTLAMAVTSTYAWFTTNAYVTVEGFDVNVKTLSDEGLFIKLGEIAGMSYGTSVSSANIATAIGLNGGTMTQLDALTTVDGTTLKQASSIISGNTTVTAGDNATAGMYAKFTLMFQSTKPGIIILLSSVDAATNLSTILTNGAGGGVFTAWDYSGVGTGITEADLLAHSLSTYQLSNLTFPYAASDSIPVRAANAARVTFDSSTVGDKTIVWGPNAYNNAIQTGYYLNTYGWTVTLPADYKTDANIINDLVLGTEVAGTVTNTPTVICTLEQEGSVYVGTVVVYVWLDGNDGSCINTIGGDSFSIDMQFRRIDAPVG